jgi:hypothetical protein
MKSVVAALQVCGPASWVGIRSTSASELRQLNVELSDEMHRRLWRPCPRSVWLFMGRRGKEVLHVVGMTTRLGTLSWRDISTTP